MFEGRAARLDLPLLVPAVWLAAAQIPLFNDINVRVILASTLMAMLAARTAREFWRGRGEPLLSRWPAIVALLAYAGVALARIPATILVPVLHGDTLTGGPSFALLAFGTLLFTVIMAFLLLNMTKERTELQHRIASLIDPLSGVPTRRAFLADANKRLAAAAHAGEPLAGLLFDLDRLKEINDRRGHAAGDAVLQIFAGIATRTLGGEALLGRIGGEEFGALVPAAELGEAHAVADRVRRNFAVAAAAFADEDLRPSVSIGAAMCDGERDVNVILSVADRALCRAKALGRDRVETIESQAVEAADVGALSIAPLIPSNRPAPAPPSKRALHA